MKKFRGVAMGFIAGALSMVTVTAFAAYAQVPTTVLNDVIFSFNGEKKASPSDQPVLNYNGYTYLPVRYIAEQLGADEDWDAATKLVSVNLKPKVVEKVVEKEVPYYVTDPDKVSVSYSEMPISVVKDDFKVNLTAITRDKGLGWTKFYVECYNKNTESKTFTIVNRSAKLTVDGKDVDLYATTSKWDQQWGATYINKINNDSDRTEGFLLFQLIPSDWHKADLSFDVMDNEGKTKTYTYHVINEYPTTDTNDDD